VGLFQLFIEDVAEEIYNWDLGELQQTHIGRCED
jgi:hypothetical protein